MASVAGRPTQTNLTMLLALPTLSIHQILDARVPRRDSSRQLVLWRTLPLRLRLRKQQRLVHKLPAREHSL